MKTTKKMIGTAALTAALAVAGCSTNSNNSDELMTSSLAGRKPGDVQTLQNMSVDSGGFKDQEGTVSCVGAYSGSAPITNGATGTIWFTAPAGATNCTITDTSGIESPYLSVVYAYRRSNGSSWCGTNTVSFPVLASQQYKFTIYIKNTPPPPTNGQVLTLDVEWNP